MAKLPRQPFQRVSIIRNVHALDRRCQSNFAHFELVAASRRILAKMINCGYLMAGRQKASAAFFAKGIRGVKIVVVSQIAEK
jgi:hypothetical protein